MENYVKEEKECKGIIHKGRGEKGTTGEWKRDVKTKEGRRRNVKEGKTRDEKR